MNADEVVRRKKINEMDIDTVVRALRICNQPKGHRCSVCPVFSRYEHRICKATVDRFAADLIESLQAQLADYHHMSELVDGKMEENQRLRRINENLQAQLNDAVPVVRGEWKSVYLSGYKPNPENVCSECDCWSHRRSNFCPNCGAKMESVG